ncbi:hypothetical protein DFH08DRAFT_896238 [Mycena albidolilacea]|uniref:Uncharacterized protein n=1 Tax=Mycena albidolilacea TaxID=1033008 RepID=A0AAD6Z9H6_9AGAR|nr:hypothetical protein DFH08DRAFT_896238 [Mycena albidolilacea]
MSCFSPCACFFHPPPHRARCLVLNAVTSSRPQLTPYHRTTPPTPLPYGAACAHQITLCGVLGAVCTSAADSQVDSLTASSRRLRAATVGSSRRITPAMGLGGQGSVVGDEWRLVRACRENLRWNVGWRGAVGGGCNTNGHTAIRCRKLRGRCNAEQGDALRGERWRARCTSDPEAWVCAVTPGTRAVAGTVWTCAPVARVRERRLLWRSSMHGRVPKAKVLVVAQAMR